ncbi:MAG: RsmD family RNA methyltransferase [Saprospiraceae bacterium]
MRIIGGEFKGRKFFPPAKNWPTRPTTDFAKEGLFNMLYNSLDFEEVKVLDIFGGTGNHSYEFISRGCRDVTYVDRHGPCVAFVKKTAKVLEIEDRIRIFKMDVFKFIEKCPDQFDYIFAGPPYAISTMESIPDLIIQRKLLKKGAYLVLEHDPNHDFQQHSCFVKARNYGKTIFSFFAEE